MAKKEKVVKNNKDKTSFFKSFKAELKKVIWPTPKQLFNNTTAVLVIVLITALIVFVLDFAFESVNKYGIDKIKYVITNSEESNNISDGEIQEDLTSVDEDVENTENVSADDTSDATVEE